MVEAGALYIAQPPLYLIRQGKGGIYAYNDKELDVFTNQIIAKITNNLEKFNYNVIIANMYETYNFLIDYVKNNKNINNLYENYKKILICFSPIIPHFSSECLSSLGEENIVQWPDYDENLLDKKMIDIVVQINGKKRALINATKDIKRNDLLSLISKDKIGEKFLLNKEIKKVIFVENRLINILINE